MWLKELFSESSGALSSTRVMAFELVNAGIALAFLAFFRDKINMELISLSVTLIGLGLTGKLIQKPIEEKGNTP